MEKTKKAIIFICTGNLFRSPFAAAVFESQLVNDGIGDQWIVDSAGTWVEKRIPIPPRFLQIAFGKGIDLKNHVSREVTQELIEGFDLIITMEKSHKEALGVEFPEIKARTYLLSEVVDGVVYDIPDPVKDMEHVDILLDELFQLMQRGYSEIMRLATRS